MLTAIILNLNKIQSYQYITFRKTTNLPPYIFDQTFYNDMRMKTIEVVSIIFYKRVFLHSGNHEKPHIIQNLNTLTLPEDTLNQI